MSDFDSDVQQPKLESTGQPEQSDFDEHFLLTSSGFLLQGWQLSSPLELAPFVDIVSHSLANWYHEIVFQ